MRSARLRLVIAAVAALAVGTVGTSEADGSSQQVKQTCVKAGLARPGDLRGHFWLQILEHSTGPHGGLEYNLKTMPDACIGYRRILFTNIRFKTSLRGWRTLHGLGDTRPPGQVEKPVVWIPTYNSNEATGATKYSQAGVTIFSELSDNESTKAPWGKVQQVEMRVRLWVKDLRTRNVVGHTIFKVPTKFCRKEVRNRACAF